MRKFTKTMAAVLSLTMTLTTYNGYPCICRGRNQHNTSTDN